MQPCHHDVMPFSKEIIAEVAISLRNNMTRIVPLPSNFVSELPSMSLDALVVREGVWK